MLSVIEISERLLFVVYQTASQIWPIINGYKMFRV